MGRLGGRARNLIVLVSAAALGPGCVSTKHQAVAPPEVPRELNKIMHPDYVIEPPDVLRLDAVRIVPRPPYRVQPLDAINVQVTRTLPDAPIAGTYPVDPDGMVDLGFMYGRVTVVDMTLPEVRQAVAEHLRTFLKPGYEVAVSLAQSRGLQQIRGDHLVGQDGRVTLGLYGSVKVAGMTREQARAAIEAHLSQYLLRPEIALDVIGYNSKVYYLVTDGGGYGEQVYRVPITGNETVLDAVSQVYGLPPVASKQRIWVARPAPAGGGCQFQTLPVDWQALVEGGATDTNYQLFPGDRVYVKAQPIITLDTRMARLLSPVERLFGVTLLGTSTVNSIWGRTLNGSNTGH